MSTTTVTDHAAHRRGPMLIGVLAAEVFAVGAVWQAPLVMSTGIAMALAFWLPALLWTGRPGWADVPVRLFWQLLALSQGGVGLVVAAWRVEVAAETSRALGVAAWLCVGGAVLLLTAATLLVHHMWRDRAPRRLVR